MRYLSEEMSHGNCQSFLFHNPFSAGASSPHPRSASPQTSSQAAAVSLAAALNIEPVLECFSRCSAAAVLLATGAAGQLHFKIHSSVKNISQATKNIHVSSLSAFARDPLMGSKHYETHIGTPVASD